MNSQQDAAPGQGINALLHEAYREEWLAYYQYWVGAKLVVGPMRAALEDELLHSAEEELEHVAMVADLIIARSGLPATKPPLRYLLSSDDCKMPGRAFALCIITQNLETERDSIRRYERLARKARGADSDTHALAVQLLSDELAHEADLFALAADLHAQTAACG